MPSQKRDADGKRRSRIVEGETFSGLRILVVDPTQALPQVLNGITGATISITTLNKIDADLLARIAPDMVLSPLFSADHDILDLARRLDQLGYQGALRAYSPPLPNARLVQGEVRQIWGKRDFDIFEMPGRAH